MLNYVFPYLSVNELDIGQTPTIMSSNTTDVVEIGEHSGTWCIALDWLFTTVFTTFNFILCYWLPKYMKANKTLDVPSPIRIFIMFHFLWLLADFVYIQVMSEWTIGVAPSWVIAIIVAVAAMALGVWKVGPAFVAAFVLMMMITRGWIPLIASAGVAIFSGGVIALVLLMTDMARISNLILTCEAIALNATIGIIGMFANAFHSSIAPSTCLDRHINMLWVCASDCDLVTTNDDMINRSIYLLIAAAIGICLFVYIYNQVVCNTAPETSDTKDRKKRSCLYRTFCCCFYKDAKRQGFQRMSNGYAHPTADVGQGGGVAIREAQKKAEMEKFERDMGFESLDKLPQVDLDSMSGDESDSDDKGVSVAVAENKRKETKQSSAPLLAPTPDKPLPLPPTAASAASVVVDVKAAEQKAELNA
jgi:hypothetical protein